MRNVFTIALCLSALPAFSQLKFETYYGNMAGWGSTTDIGVSYNDKGFYVTSKLAYIQSFGLGEDADNFGLVLGAGKDWFIAKHWFAGGQLDLRWTDTNLQDVGLGAAAPSVYLGYSWEIVSYQVQLGLPYFIGVQAKFPFKI